MAKLRIDRKAHPRSGYVRKGRHVSRTHVRRTVYLAKDRGKKGRVPLEGRWSRGVKFKNIKGYTIDEPAKKRLAALRKSISTEGGGHKGRLSTARTLQSIVNVNPSKESDRIMRGDIQKVYPQWGKGKK